MLQKPEGLCMLEKYIRMELTFMHRNSGLTVITTHINADFDALASMLAAQKLYPDSLVIFPGSQEKNLRNFFIQSMVYLLNIANVKDIDFKAISRLVLVDTRQPHRIGKFAAILDRPGLDVHIFDHHPPMAAISTGPTWSWNSWAPP
jgi:tRNA nucleotidyltransferase (CCA-adding enzyme)